jgi:Xaa-Pro aminopeptidase
MAVEHDAETIRSWKSMKFDMIHGRVKKLRELMETRELDAFILIVIERFNSESCRYISGFRGSSAALVIDDKREILVTDGRYQTQAALQSPFALTLQTQGVPLPESVAKIVSDNGYRSVGFESEKLSHGVVENVLKKTKTDWKDASALIPFLRRS